VREVKYIQDIAINEKGNNRPKSNPYSRVEKGIKYHFFIDKIVGLNIK